MKSSFFKDNGAQIAFFVITLAAASTLLLFVHFFGKQILFGDKLTFWSPFFEDQSFWQGFSSKNGIHGFGFIYILSSASIYLFNWQVKADLIVNASIIIGSVLIFFFVLQQTFNRKLIYSDVFIPLTLLSLAPYGTLLYNPHVHVMLPFFALLFCLLALKTQGAVRLFFSSILIFLAIYSGFAFIAAFVFLLVLAYQKWHENRKFKLDTELVFLCCFGLFLFGIFWFQASHSSPEINLFALQNLVVFKDLLLNAFGLARVGGNSFLAAVYISVLIFLLRNFRENWKNANLKQRSVFLQLFLSSLGFAILVTLGRSDFHPDAGLASRYYSTLCLIPVSLYVLGRTSSPKNQYGWITLGIAMFVVPIESSISSSKRTNQALQEVENCFAKSGSEREMKSCVENTKASFYPNLVRDSAPKRMMLLKEKKRGQFYE